MTYNGARSLMMVLQQNDMPFFEYADLVKLHKNPEMTKDWTIEFTGNPEDFTRLEAGMIHKCSPRQTWGMLVLNKNKIKVIIYDKKIEIS